MNEKKEEKNNKKKHSRFHFFVTGSYAMQVIKDLFGPGKHDVYDLTETW